jgi:hypothetical protein
MITTFIPLHADVKNPISWRALLWLYSKLYKHQKLLMPYSSIEPNGLHYPPSFDKGMQEPSPCYFAGCVPNMPCKVEAYEKYCAEQYEPTNLDDLIY